jgi:hypothetical protein
VTRDHDIESGAAGLQIQLRQIVENVDRDACGFEHGCFWQFPRPRALVDVAPHGGDGGDGGEFLEDVG